MKKLFIAFLIPLSFMACTSSTTDTTSGSHTDSLPSPPLPLPYTAAYTADWVPGKPGDVLTVLNSYKAWETNDMKLFRSTVSDTLEMVFASGMRMKGTADSMVNMAGKFRDSLSSVVLTIYTWTSDHSTSKNDDWVTVWYKEIDTYKTGKVDSVYYVDDNMLKNGKIAYVSSYTQKILKKK